MNTVNFQVAGVSYRLAAFAKANLQRGHRLTLKAEPDNEYDPSAIKVLAGEHFIGYVPRTHNSLLAEIVNDPESGLQCAVTSVWPGGCSARAMWGGAVATQGTL